MTAFKDITEAMAALSPPLVFGAQVRIDAVDFVRIYEGAAACLTIEAYSRGTCAECEGDGEVDCECDCGDVHSKECQSCDGEGEFPVSRQWLDTLDMAGLERVIDQIQKLGVVV